MRCLFVLISALFLSSTPNAEIHVNVNFNIDNQPIWGPSGYDYVEYYYLPQIEIYYNVPQHLFIYFEGGNWVTRTHLPFRYRNYDLYKSYKIVVKEREPYLNHKKYKEKYSSYGNRHDQLPIRDSRDSKYFVNINHPEHNKWVKQQNNGKDKKGKNNNRAKNSK